MEIIMMYDSYDALSAKEYRKMCADDGVWKRFRGASKVATGNGYAHLMSYKTAIASFYDVSYTPSGEYRNQTLEQIHELTIGGKPTLWVNHLACEYSNTTSRHLSLFLSRYCRSVTYHDVKSFLNDATIGEIKMINGVWIVCI